MPGRGHICQIVNTHYIFTKSYSLLPSIDQKKLNNYRNIFLNGEIRAKYFFFNIFKKKLFLQFASVDQTLHDNFRLNVFN